MPGETVKAATIMRTPGGKGGNQAAAAAAAGASTPMIGAVGEDASGEQLLDSLRSRGVDIGSVTKVAGSPRRCCRHTERRGSGGVWAAP
jgi:ribokinase